MNAKEISALVRILHRHRAVLTALGFDNTNEEIRIIDVLSSKLDALLVKGLNNVA